MTHPRAGQLAGPEDLIDVSHLVTAYFAVQPDPADPMQQVVFGTSGHRGSSLDAAFNEPHILATTQAICEYRAGQGFDGPLFLGRDTHGLSEPAWVTAIEVLIANEVTVLVDSADRYTPTPAVSHAILRANGGRTSGAGLADGIVVTPSHNPPRDGGFKYNPPHGGPADTDATGWIAARANELLAAGLDGVRRIPYARARSVAEPYDFMITLRRRPADRARPRRDPGGRRAHRRGSTRRRQRRLLGDDRRTPPARPDRGEPPGRPDVAVHDARLGRQDPDGLLIPSRHGVVDLQQGRVPDRHRQRRRRRPARDRHAGRRADEPEPLPRGRDQLPLRRTQAAGHRMPRLGRPRSPRP